MQSIGNWHQSHSAGPVFIRSYTEFMVRLLRNYIISSTVYTFIILLADYSVQRFLMSRKHGQLPVAETDREDNDSISDKPSTVPDPDGDMSYKLR